MFTCPIRFLSDSLPVAMSVLALGWITLQFCGGDRAQVKGPDRGHAAVRSGGHRYADAGEVIPHEDVPNSFDSFRDVEMAVFDRTAD